MSSIQKLPKVKCWLVSELNHSCKSGANPSRFTVDKMSVNYTTSHFNKLEILHRLLTIIDAIFHFFWQFRCVSGHKPQWQKSEEMMKRLEGSARYLLSSLPYSCSLDSLRAPTSTGTMLNSSLWLFLKNKSQNRIIC